MHAANQRLQGLIRSLGRDIWRKSARGRPGLPDRRNARGIFGARDYSNLPALQAMRQVRGIDSSSRCRASIG